MNPVSHEGGCLCGAVRYRARAEAVARTLCHCRSCRRAAGAPSVAWAVFPADAFAFIAGEPARFRSSPDVVRTFCAVCGTSLTWQHAARATMDVTTASLDEPDRFAPDCEIWTSHKLAWEAVDAARPSYPRSSREGAGAV